MSSEYEFTCSYCLSCSIINENNMIQYTCNHSLCQNCFFHNFFFDIYSLLQDYVSNDVITLSCPICKNGYYQNTSESFFTIFESFYSNIFNKNSLANQNIYRCQKHNLPSDIYCEQCRVYFCKKCISIHNGIGNNSYHSLIKNESKSKILKYKCSYHNNEQIDFYCENCNQLICNQCLNENHKLHNIIRINNFISNAINNILNYKDSNFNAALEKLSQNKNNFENKFLEDYQATIIQLDKIIAYFQQVKQEYIDKMEHLHSKQNELNEILLLSYNIVDEEIKQLTNLSKKTSNRNNFDIYNIYFLNEIANMKEIENNPTNEMINGIKTLNNCLINNPINKENKDNKDNKENKENKENKKNENNEDNNENNEDNKENNELDTSELSLNEETSLLLTLIKENNEENNNTKSNINNTINNKNEYNLLPENSYSFSGKNQNNEKSNSSNEYLLPIQMSSIEKLKGYKLTGNIKKFNYAGSITLSLSTEYSQLYPQSNVNIFSVLPNINFWKIFFLSNNKNANKDYNFVWKSNNTLKKLNNNNDNKVNSTNSLILSENEFAKISENKIDIEVFQNNNPKPFQRLIGHKGKINSIILIKYKTFCTGGEDNLIKLWELITNINIEKFYCKQTLKEHKGRINNMLFMKEKLISCSSDTTIKIWDYDKDLGMSYIQTLNQHKAPVISILQFNDNILISSDKNSIMKIWVIEDNNEEQNNNHDN